MFKKMKQKVTISILSSAFLLVSMTGTAFAEVTSSSHLDYVALGDSLAAGQTPNRNLATGYTDLIADNLASAGVLGNFNNFGVSGYTTSNVLSALPNELNAIRHAEIVTIDAGANDILTDAISLISIDTSIDTLESQKSLINSITFTISTTIPKNITAIISKIKSVNKNAKIYVMGYYNPFTFLTPEQQALVYPLLTSLNSSIEAAAVSSGATYVDTYVSMDNPKDPIDQYTNIPNPYDIHPSIDGYQIIAADFWTKINEDFIKISK